MREKGEGMPSIRRKNTICATVSPYIAEKVERYVASGRFSSKSDLVSNAVMEFIIRLEAEEGRYAHLHPKDRAIEEEIDRLMEDMEEGEELIVDRGTGEVRKVEKKG